MPNTNSKPLYVVAGVGDLAVSKLRDLQIPEKVRSGELRTKVVDATQTALVRATSAYEKLAERGEKAVSDARTRRGKPTSSSSLAVVEPPAVEPAAKVAPARKATPPRKTTTKNT
ncbi:MAG: hypothetical protein ACJ73S_01205 [Mycobacteriales bacterium]